MAQLQQLPKTSKRHYITGMTALNIPLPEEGYGDWHFIEAFYGRGSRSPKMFLAGEGEEWSTQSIFGEFGIYECSEKLKKMGIVVPSGQKVYVAGHYRAVLDMLYRSVKRGRYPHHLDIEHWFDNEEQKKALAGKVKEMKGHLTPNEWSIIEQWLKTLI